MLNFDMTPIAPISKERMIHIKPAHGHTWGYHPMQTRYCASALSHYKCITVTNTGAVHVHVMDTFKFKHHVLLVPTVSNRDRIVKVMHHLVHVCTDCGVVLSR